MNRPKNFLFVVLLLTVLAIAVATAFHETRQTHPAAPTEAAPETGQRGSPASPGSTSAPPPRTPSGAEKRAKDFNDAASRFNAPDSQ